MITPIDSGRQRRLQRHDNGAWNMPYSSGIPGADHGPDHQGSRLPTTSMTTAVAPPARALPSWG
ncbi:hypothetical protein IM697_22940 [Streptomyces ferrugineus]|uniref:Uncharacterized protein n=1 Tax=Streptomyces ferrugineus TaxID=1413221 RepID=A0A7M2SA04_9ACTN|nr:hypothetical protein [Streptomyces ferrugineus]QOV33124.1 hypothetical protein IM697_22940 [Streptomyces ferrugineus]